MDPRGHNSGQSWTTFVDALVAEHGSLVVVAERLAAARGHTEDVASIERALRRLRHRGNLPGGTWGTRILKVFGLPGAVDARLRFMGAYHSRFVDLPVPLCADLVQLWDRPPTNETPAGRQWLGLARAIIALRSREWADARRWLDAAARGGGDPAARIEAALGLAFLGSREKPSTAAGSLAPIPDLLGTVEDAADRACLAARYAGQVAHGLNRAGDFAAAEAAHLALPDDATAPPYARARRANGLAFSRYVLGDPEAALALARESARHAGDAGHVRLRAMALLMIARISPDSDEGRDARERAARIGDALDDAILHVRSRR